MAKSRRRSQRRRSRKRRGGRNFITDKINKVKSAISSRVGIGALVARYIKQVLQPNTDYPKTRQLMLDSFIYASLLAKKKADGVTDPNAFSQIPQPKFGVHYITGKPVQGSSGEEEAIKEAGQQDQAGGRRRRSRKKRRKSKKSKSRRRRR